MNVVNFNVRKLERHDISSPSKLVKNLLQAKNLLFGNFFKFSPAKLKVYGNHISSQVQNLK